MGSLGGAFGLSTLLGNLEAAAEGAPSPPRFLLLFWPSGVVKQLFVPSSSGAGYLTTPCLQPIEDAGLRADTIGLFGPGDRVPTKGTGGEEGGVVLRTTGAAIPGTRLNPGGEGDDGVAGGPSMDQIFLKNVARFAVGAGPGYLNAIGDARVGSLETSCRCLSYSYQTRSIAAANPADSIITEHVPLYPELSPSKAYAQVFGSFIPGRDPGGQALKALALRKSVLDYARRELGRLRTLAPASEREKLDMHEDAIRKLEMDLSGQTDGQTPSCEVPPAPDSAVSAPFGSANLLNELKAEHDESAALARTSELHLGVIRAAFQCDLLRVATFQFASSSDWTAFAGLMPGDPAGAYRHNSVMHAVSTPDVSVPPANPYVQFLANVNTWYNTQAAKFIKTLKETRDALGNPLLDSTIVPFVTDMASYLHDRSPLAALIFGGRALGMQGGQFQNLESERSSFNDVWLTVAQAYFPDVDVEQALAQEIFVQGDGAIRGPIAGLWSRPA